MGTPYANAPIVCVIAQIMHNPVPKIDEGIAKIQDLFRSKGLPGYQAVSQVAVRFPSPTADGQRVQLPQIENVNRHIFTDTSLKAALILDKEAFTFISTGYVNFDDFQRQFSIYLSEYLSVFPLDYVERIGVRYIDAFVPLVEGAFESCVVSGVLGISQNLDQNIPIMHTVSETRYLLPDLGSVTARSTLRLGEFEAPMGIDLSYLKVDQKFEDIDGLHVTLDSDAVSEGRVPFDIDEVVKRVDELHKGAALAFNATVTTQAKEAWR